MVLTACGAGAGAGAGDDDLINHGDGATPGDAARPDGPAMGIVTVELVDGASGIPIVFTDASGAVVTEATSDATGHASATVQTDAAVTVVRPSALLTIAGVQPGDHLLIGLPGGLAPALRMTASWPAPTLPVGYFEVGTQGTFTPAQPLERTESISYYGPAGTAFDAYIVSRSNQAITPYKVHQYMHQAGVVPVANGSFTFTGAWQTPEAVTATYANRPADVTRIHGRLEEQIGGAYQYGAGADTVYNAPGDYTLHFDRVPVAGATLVLNTTVTSKTVDGTRKDSRRVAVASDVGFDLDTLLPLVTGATLSPTHDLAWTTDRAATADFAVANLYYRTTKNWTIVGPTGSGALHLPVLPSDVADAPQPGDALTFHLTLTELDHATYDDLRNELGTKIGPYFAAFDVLDPRVPAATTQLDTSSVNATATY